MKNLGQMLKQAQEMQAKVEQLQRNLGEAEITGTAGGGMVSVVLSGTGQMRRLSIDPALIDPTETAVLEDLIVAAHNDAKAKVEAHSAEEMRKLTGGIDLPPGFKLPF